LYFELVSTCDIAKGHQVTFWYGDDLCADAVLAVYGIATLPSLSDDDNDRIAPCKTSLEWKQRTKLLEERLKDAVEDFEILERELEEVETILSECCGDGDDAGAAAVRSDDANTVSSDEDEDGLSNSLRRGGPGGVMGGIARKRSKTKRSYKDEEF
jgi:hypothetical protein